VALGILLAPVFTGAGRQESPPLDMLVLKIAEAPTAAPAAASWRHLKVQADSPVAVARAAFWGLPVDLNEADAATLRSVPGIGATLAAALVAAREAAGGFRSWRDVDAVRGVGPALLGRLQSSFTLSGRPR
jgi:competence ComEA-like helix-hairpin-helix protein